MADDPKKLPESQVSGRVEIGLETPLFFDASTEIDKERDEIKNKTALTLLELGSHTLVLGLTLGSIWIIHLIFDALLGKDAKFFTHIPISWVIDAAHLAAIGKFIWEIIRDFKKRK